MKNKKDIIAKQTALMGLVEAMKGFELDQMKGFKKKKRGEMEEVLSAEKEEYSNDED